MKKGESGIRIVHHGSDDGINIVVWAPPFLFPTVLTLVRKLEPNTHQLGSDIGEMFLNFPLYPAVWEHCGVNLKGIKGLKLPSERSRLVWTTL